MKNDISLTLPMDARALRQGAIMLNNIAEGIEHPIPLAAGGVDTIEYTNLKDEKITVHDEVATGALPISDPVVEPAAPEVFAEKVENPATLEVVTTTVDVRGMAWDKRIHASTKTKLANGNWKNKRGVHYQTLEDVEAELLAVPDPVTETVTPPPPTQASTVSTFPELMAAITGNSMAPDDVLAAVKSVGLESLPLLAARPDLVPAVAKELGV